MSALASAGILTINGTLESVDTTARTISVEVDGESKTFNVSRKAKVSVEGESSLLDSFKPVRADAGILHLCQE